jgi:phosphate transport system substrate-binding protein
VKTLPALVAWAVLACAGSLACAQNVSSLPEYEPQTLVSGVLRSWGSNHMAMLMKYWQEGFRRYQPNVRFEDSLKGTASAQFGLHVNVADLALSGREIFPYEYYGIYRRSQLYPMEIAVATGSFDVRSKSTALGVFVHKDNPLSKLTLAQLDGIYGDQRTGGWQKIEWVEKGVARSAKDNIRTWGALGLTGEWADKPIHVYGPPGLYPGGVSFFQTRVMGGADTWNESLQEFDDRKLMLEALGNDRYGIAYAAMAYRTAQVKPLALSETAAGPFVEPTRSNVGNRTYPLARTAYIYFAPDRPTGDPRKVDPKIKEFLRYVLSRQGQSDVEREGDYLPLTADLVREQRRKLE